MPPPKIQTYHCLCSTLLFASTHVLSTLPRRQSDTNTDGAIILPLPSTPPFSSNPNTDTEGEEKLFPEAGYTTLFSLTPDRKISIIRREEGFEKRVLWRCGRCRLVVGYQIPSPPSQTSHQTEGMDIDSGSGKGKEREGEVFEGKILYILPGGVMSTEIMVGGRKIGEGDVEIAFSGGGEGKAVAVFE